MSRIEAAFQQGKAFAAFITCGDPDLETTKALIMAMADAGADLIELGIPFSDPTAEGPVIQEASRRALSVGVTTDQIFTMVKELRKELTLPLVVMTYANVLFSYGTERFIKTAAECKIDGIILPDVPFEEKEEFAAPCRSYGLQYISLIAPTSKERITTIAKEAEGFLYCVSSLGVTGERGELSCDVASMVSLVKEVTHLPVAIGFGISTPEQAKQMGSLADGIIIGSAIVRRIGEHGTGAIAPVAEYVKEIKDSLRSLSAK